VPPAGFDIARHIWLVPALPAAAFVLIGVFCLRGQRGARAAPALLICALAAAGVLAALAIYHLASVGGQPLQWGVRWLSVEKAQPALHADIGTLLDPLSAVVMLVVCAVSLAVQVYSVGYMRGDPGYARYFAFMSLFSTSMLGLVLSNNLVLTYIFWELVGICSYLLIGFWYKKPEAANAAKKAFIVTRFGDVGFLLGVLALSLSAGSLNLVDLERTINGRALKPLFLGESAFVTVVALLIFSGAVGKSAQFPLHVWLPDAMEGPTPVSALIHAATMVAAGVYLVARTSFLFSASPVAMTVVAIIGAFTAFMAATMATAQDDIKRILAYSTISQLGYMMLGLGAGAFSAAIFHLTTHAWFKALLFFVAGSVIHATHTNSIWEMGGLWRSMRATAIIGAIGGLALIGIAPLSGFFSKDAILAGVASSEVLAQTLGPLGRQVLFIVGLAVIPLTGFYISRLWFVTFAGRRDESRGKAHESPGVMLLPMAFLAALAIVAGWAQGWFANFVQFAQSDARHAAHVPWLPPASVLLGLAGIAYARMRVLPAAAAERRPKSAVHIFLKNHWYIDYAYHWAAWKIVLGFAAVAAWFDRHVVDGMVNGVAWLAGRFAFTIRRSETGQLQFYALVIFLGALAAALAALRASHGMWGP
jgi:NADH-quinone oxidoreductase subunit L